MDHRQPAPPHRTERSRHVHRTTGPGDDTMTSTLPRELRSARLRTLGALALRLDDLCAANAAVDEALTRIVRDDADLSADAVTPLLRHAWAAADQPSDPPDLAPDESDEALVLLAACCHGSLPEAARIALMLSVAGGLPTGEIACAFSVPDDVMARRLTWSRQRAGTWLREPITPELRAMRLGRVLDVLMLIFDDGIVHPHCPADLPLEAVEIARVVLELFPGEAEPRALLAIMLLTRARRAARQDEDGAMVPLGSQDRSLWHRAEIDEGLFLLRGSQRQNRFGPYQLRASIQAAHVTAQDTADTDWDRILALHDQLMQVDPSDAVALSRGMALAEVRGAESALAFVEGLGLDSHVFHATRADLLARLGRTQEAEQAWLAAVARVRGAQEHARLRGTGER
jgi:RNA polymerase sigma-70 factor (ECF subfamily)